MFQRDKTLKTKNISYGKNTIEYIILHSTWSMGTKWNIDRLLWKVWKVSCHFYIDPKWLTYKLAEPHQITWHAWESHRWDLRLMNRYSLGIEVEWVDTFTDIQFDRTIELVKHLQNVYKIPEENILTHASIVWTGSRSKRLRDGVSSSRKVDIHRNFRWERWIKSFVEFRKKYFSWK